MYTITRTLRVSLRTNYISKNNTLKWLGIVHKPKFIPTLSCRQFSTNPNENKDSNKQNEQNEQSEQNEQNEQNDDESSFEGNKIPTEELHIIMKAIATNKIEELPFEIIQKYGKEQIYRIKEVMDKKQEKAKSTPTGKLFLKNLEYQEQLLKKEDEDDVPNDKKDNGYSVPMWLGLILLIMIIINRQINEDEIIEKYNIPLENRVMSPDNLEKAKLIPTRFLSQIFGKIAAWEAPSFLLYSMISIYAKLYGCNLEEAVKSNIEEYKTLQEFFQRELKPGIRPIDQEALLTSPVDGRIVHYGYLDPGSDKIEQIKGISYSLREFMGEDSPLFLAMENLKDKLGPKDLYYCIIYLAPGDYHGYHSSVDWSIRERKHYPGHLFPVADWSTHAIKGVLSINERVVLNGEWKHGFFSYIPIGAYNVGSITFTFENDFNTNLREQSAVTPPDFKTYSSPVQIGKGDKIGSFGMGSCIVMVFEGPQLAFVVPRGSRVKLGEPIAVEMTPELAQLHLKTLDKRLEELDNKIRSASEDRDKLEKGKLESEESKRKLKESLIQSAENRTDPLKSRYAQLDPEKQEFYKQLAEKKKELK